MRKVSVLNHGLNTSSLDSLLSLVESVGSEKGDVEVIDQIGDPSDACDDEIILILLTPELCQDPVLETELSKAPKGGRRAICIWPVDAADCDIPAAVEKFCYSLVSWNVERLRVVLKDDDVTCFEMASGQPRPTPDTERYECV